jgi:hypothetical protein
MDSLLLLLLDINDWDRPRWRRRAEATKTTEKWVLGQGGEARLDIKASTIFA